MTTTTHFQPRPVLASGYRRCLRLPVRPSVRQSIRHQVCPRDNSSLIQARITKFGPEVQNTLLKVRIVFGEQLTFTFKVKFDLFSDFTTTGNI